MWMIWYSYLYKATRGHYGQRCEAKSHRQLFHPYWGLVSVAYWWFLRPPQVKHLWFQQRQIEAISQGVTVRSNRQRWELFLDGKMDGLSIHQYATLTSLNKGETAVSGSPTFLLDDWGGDHLLLQIRLRSPGHASTFVDLVSWRNIQWLLPFQEVIMYTHC